MTTQQTAQVPAAGRAGLPLAAVLLACLAAGCTPAHDLAAGASRTPAPASVAVRPPAVGQEWIYQVRNLYNQRIVDEITERVVAVDPLIRIQRSSRAGGTLADEVHASWGMVIQDSHWNYPLTFSTPLPAWPVHYDLGRSTTYSDRYELLAAPDYSAYWSLTITPRDWVSIRVPAGDFTAVHFDNVINFQNEDLTVIESQRLESVWFAPRIGRWVLRRSHGTYYLPGRGGEMLEDYLQWELVAWR